MLSHEYATVTLSQEELYYLLVQLGADGMLGLDTAPLATVSGAQREKVFDVARRALESRGLLAATADGELNLDKGLRAAVHGAAFADRSLIAIVRREQAAEEPPLIVHRSKLLWIVHTQPAAGLHTFALCIERPPVSRDLGQLLGLARQPAPPGTPFTIDQTMLENALGVASSRQRAAVGAALSAAGVDEQTAVSFAELLCRPHRSAVIQLLERHDHSRLTQTIALFDDGCGFWMAAAAPPDLLRCVPVNAAQLGELLRDLEEAL